MRALGKLEGEELMGTLSRLLASGSLILVNVALFLSAVSTLDSTLSSAAKLTVVNMRMARPTLINGRWSMVMFMGAGLAMLLVGSDDLFAAVAVSGTASVFLTPVVVLCIWGGWRVSPLAYAAAFGAAMCAAGAYFLESSGYITIVGSLTGFEHKYTKLLVITAAVLAAGFIAFVIGRQGGMPVETPQAQPQTAGGGGDG